MFIGHIAGFLFLPISILMYFNAFSITNLQKIFGIPIILIGAIGIIIIEVGDIIHSHFSDEHTVLTWIIGGILMFPAFLYFLSLIIKFPASIIAALPLITASFLFVEGLSSFYI